MRTINLSTTLEWDDLVLTQQSAKELDHIKKWLANSSKISNDWKLDSLIGPGYKALFAGPSGTGKTLAATLLAKENAQQQLQSIFPLTTSYIGETETNLSNFLNEQADKGAILFFDEADALFGKRTEVKSASDRYANQEVSYLLQRIEAHPGLVIVALEDGLPEDGRILRMFDSVVNFPFPDREMRLQLWQMAFSKGLKPCGKIDLKDTAEKYDLKGSEIMAAIKCCAIETAAAQKDEVNQETLLAAIKKTLSKRTTTI